MPSRVKRCSETPLEVVSEVNCIGLIAFRDAGGRSLGRLRQRDRAAVGVGSTRSDIALMGLTSSSRLRARRRYQSSTGVGRVLEQQRLDVHEAGLEQVQREHAKPQQALDHYRPRTTNSS